MLKLNEEKQLSVTHHLYELLVEEDEVGVCEDISDEACPNVPHNFLLFGSAGVITRLADELANAKTILPWLLSSLGASELWISLLVPVRESMSMLPQLAIASLVQRRPRRQQAWVWGALLQAAALAVMAVGAFFVAGWGAGLLVVGLLLVFSLARAVCSVASKEILGKVIPKRRRGRLNGYKVAVAGVLTLAIGALLTTYAVPSSSVLLFVTLLGVAAALWVMAALLMSRVREVAGKAEEPEHMLRESWRRLSLVRTDPELRRFLMVRALLISTALAAPYYVLIARESGAARSLGVFVIASGLASAISSAFWGRFADKSSRTVLLIAGGFASLLGLLFSLLVWSGLLGAQVGYLAPVAFFLLMIAHSGVRIGRKTYVVDLATGENRIDYVAVSNTIIGAVVLLSGALGLLAPLIGAAGMLLLLSLCGLAGVSLGAWLPEAE